jgi:hypothetical protein
MDELIKRLGSATEGSLELDEQISVFVGTVETLFPRYTTSIGSALTLAEPNCAFRLSRHAQTGRCRALIGGSVRSGMGPTPALALCIAALRARSAS